MSAPSFLHALERRRLFSALPTVYAGDTWVAEGNSGTNTAVLTMSLVGRRGNQSVTVDYATQDGSAVAGADYRAASGRLTFAAGETSKTIQVPLIGDRAVEADESFVVNLRAVKNARIGDGQGSVTIADDEPRVYVNDAYASEGNSGTTPFSFTVGLSAAYDVPVTVAYATADGSALAGSDYAASAGTVTFAPGETSQTVAVPVFGDRLIEDNENFSLNLSNASTHAAIGRGTAFGTIADDEPRISISDAVNYWGDTAAFTFTVSLSAAADEVVTVNFVTLDGTAFVGQDYAAASGTLTFAAGETTQTVQVELLNPDFADRYFYVVLSDATNAPIANGQATAYWYYDSGGYYDPGYGYGYDYGYYYY